MEPDDLIGLESLARMGRFSRNMTIEQPGDPPEGHRFVKETPHSNLCHMSGLP